MRVRRGWPLVLLLVLLVVVPTTEIWLLFQVSDQIGVWPTVAVLVAEAVLGTWLIRREGSRTWQAVVGASSTGRLPAGELADAALVLVGGLLLLLPGFLTDVLGFLFLLPLTRPLARRAAAFFIARQVGRLGAPVVGLSGTGQVIPGQVVPGEAADAPSSTGRGSTAISGEVLDR